MNDFVEIRSKMLSTVRARGYDVLAPIPEIDAESAARDPWEIATQLLGEPPSMVERQPIKPVPEGRSFASNAAFTPLHTDSQMFGGVSPHMQIMFCAKAARDGGTTLLLDTHELLETIEREDRQFFQTLFTVSRRIPFVFGDVQGPTVSWRAECLVFTHSPMRVDDEIGKKLQHYISRAPVIEVPVADGRILVVDNHRMLHGRTAFTDTSRRFTRLLVWRRGPSEATELRRRIVLEMLRGIPPGMLAQKYKIPEPMLYKWRDAAIAAMDRVLDEESS